MGLFDWAKNQFIEIIEWVDDSRSTLVYRFPVYRKEIKQGAQLTVREGQAAVFVSEGQIADVFGPGQYSLQTRNLPVLATLKGWKYGFESPFKSEVYFCSTRLFTDQKWGTPNPIMMRDKDLGVLRLRAFGSYAMRIADAGAFLKQHVGTTGTVDQEAVTGHLRNLVVSRFSDCLGESGIPAFDLSAKYDELGFELQRRLNETFADQGLQLENLAIENISLPPEVEKALDQRSQMNLLGDMNRYTQFQAAQAIPTAAANQGMGGAAMGMGAGFAFGGMMTNQMAGAFAGRGYAAPDAFSPGQVPGQVPGQMPGQVAGMAAGAGMAAAQPAAAPAPAPAPAAPAPDSPEAKLKKVQALLDAGLISAEEAAAHRQKVLSELL